MASHPASTPRQNPLRSVHSFRVERPSSPEPDGESGPATRPKRAHTVDNARQIAPAALRTASGTHLTPTVPEDEPADAFTSTTEESTDPPRTSVDLDDLPIELISLTDRFVESLTAPIHPTPPTIEDLTRMFQDFYATAAAHIQTHVDTLAARQKREEREEAAPPLTSRPSAASLLRATASSLGSRPAPPKRDSEQPLLTPEELAERKRARKALESKKSELEEAVERRLCEGIYAKIYRHRSTQDEAQDAKLRSKTAALCVVGIGPVDLGVDLGIPPESDAEATTEKQKEVREWLEPARAELTLMSQARYPLGKLNHLKAAHKRIIDTLSHFHPSSSADELMPMLIYTLITLPPESLSVISDVNFIQRFRWEQKLHGEASYCLTTLEAAIAFLETVDLSTLRADETPTGPVKPPGGSPALKSETFPPAFSPTASSPSTRGPNPTETASATLTPAHQPQQQEPSPGPPPAASASFRAAVNAQLRGPRRLSDLVRSTPTPSQALNAASDAVFTTADQGLKTISTSLGDSYKFLLGKLRERAPDALLGKDSGAGGSGSAGDDASATAMVPKTLADARKLVSTPPLQPQGNRDDEAASLRGAPLTPTREEEEQPPLPPQPQQQLQQLQQQQQQQQQQPPSQPPPERPSPLLSLISGTASRRDRSADSARSATSSIGRRATATAAGSDERRPLGEATSAAPSPMALASPQLIDSVRSLGNSLNPMARISAGIGGLRAFGRSPASPATGTAAPGATGTATGTGPGAAGTPTAAEATAAAAAERAPTPPAKEVDMATAFPDLAPVLPPREHPKIRPPVARFMEAQNAADLTIGDVFELLRDYKRMARALQEMDAFLRE
ncbi:hypothetical protein VTJ83DRAFT_1158 [Remersonia thermophila]|uniref:VPS9 domain-containing protein n=1 Tax=Remersonia thermophila TaxID=72144 RepID=A0ABR4DQ50_9PEZI